MQISNAQSRAIAHTEGPAIVLAGPGSGKTLVITQRTKSLIEQHHVKPREILVITFTKAAAQEMSGRFAAICSARGVTFGTFHAVFFTILKYAYNYSPSNILTETRKFQMLRQILRGCGYRGEDEKELLPEIASEISLVKNERIDPGHYYSRSCPEELFRAVYAKYEQLHRSEGLLDFDDMLTYTWELLTAREDILAAWQRRFRYILVDEFQDINLLQYEILRLLAAPENNLFIVGDDDQSIYRFRGAKPEIMLNFPQDYPGAEQIVLDRNFRSVPPVIEGALRVISENEHRYEKKIQPVRSGGAPVDVREFQDQGHESLYIVKCIRHSLGRGVSPGEIAVLFRTNQGAAPFAGRLLEFNLPFALRDALPDIYEHWIAKDIFAYLRLASGRLRRDDFLQVMNRPKRYLGRDCAQDPTIEFERLRIYYEEKDWMLDRIDRFEADLKILGGLAPYAAVNYIRYGIGYEDYLKEYARTRKMKPEELLDLYDEIQQSAKPFQALEEWYGYIEEYHAAMKDRQAAGRAREDAVTLATLHSSKGLEFSEVFLVDVNEGVIPHRKAATEADIEEERRLFYVGMTRAKDVLHLFYVKERYGRAAEPSEFLARSGLLLTTGDE